MDAQKKREKQRETESEIDRERGNKNAWMPETVE